MQPGRPARDRGRVARSDERREIALEAAQEWTEPERARAQGLEHELLLACSDVGRREPDHAGRRRAHERAGAAVGKSRYSSESGEVPDVTAKNSAWILRVIGPGPISWSSTERIGVTSAAVPVKNTSSAW